MRRSQGWLRGPLSGLLGGFRPFLCGITNAGWAHPRRALSASGGPIQRSGLATLRGVDQSCGYPSIDQSNAAAERGLSTRMRQASDSPTAAPRASRRATGRGVRPSPLAGRDLMGENAGDGFSQSHRPSRSSLRLVGRRTKGRRRAVHEHLVAVAGPRDHRRWVDWWRRRVQT